MHFTSAKQDFLSVLSKSQGVPEQKSPSGPMAHVLFEAEGSDRVRLSAQSHEVTVSVTFPAQIVQPGSLALSARSLFDSVRMLPEAPVTIASMENDWARLSSGRTDYKIPGIAPQSVPPRKVPASVDHLEIPVALALETVERVAFAMSNDEGRPNLNGIFLKLVPQEDSTIQVEAVATDGHRLARLVRRIPLSGEVARPLGVIVHRRGIHELRRFLDGEQGNLRLGIQREAVSFEIPSGYLYVNQVELEYPDYMRVLPSGFKWQITLNRLDFVRAVARASVMASGEKAPLVRLSVQPGRLTTFAQDSAKGDAQDEQDIPYDGEPLEIAFNHRYLSEALQALPGEQVTLSVRDIGAAVALTSTSDEGALQLIMPIRS